MSHTVHVDPLGMIKNTPGFPTRWTSRKIKKFVRMGQAAFDGTRSTEQVGVYLQMGIDELRHRALKSLARMAVLLGIMAALAGSMIVITWDKRLRSSQRTTATLEQDVLEELRMLNFTLVKTMREQAE
jgi:hypothetical protein